MEWRDFVAVIEKAARAFGEELVSEDFDSHCEPALCHLREQGLVFSDRGPANKNPLAIAVLTVRVVHVEKLKNFWLFIQMNIAVNRAYEYYTDSVC